MKSFFIKLYKNGKKTDYKLDTGADVTVLTEDTFKGLDIKYRRPSKILKGANGKVMKVLGEVDICLSSRRGVNIET